jgi:decaprenylphospho-beta-D-ribofuranose 2-oxidase
MLRSDQALIARGSGRSYGDAALNDRRGVVCSAKLADRNLEFDADAGLLRASAALTQRQVLASVCPMGWVLPAIPGCREITLGGMVAADAHGKNHYAAGSMIEHVRRIGLLTADGTIVECCREQEPDLFWATAGGLGLTGMVLWVEMQLRPIASTTVTSDFHGFEGVEELMTVVEGGKDDCEYVLGWADGRFRPGWPLRGAVALGRHVPAAELEEPWALPELRTYRLPFANPLPGAGWTAAQVLNRAIARKFTAGQRQTRSINQFFFPQDAIANWNIAFGRRGFVEYHCCFPLEQARSALAEVHAFLCAERILCALVTLKRFGPAVPEAPLSFPQDGYSLALDMPVRRHVVEKLRTLDQVVVAHGGRVNPVKDSRLPPGMLRRMYPRLEEWLAVRRRVDPHRKFSSNLSRRLELDG